MASTDAFRAALSTPSPDRLLMAAQALRAGLSVEEIHDDQQVRSRGSCASSQRIVEAERAVAAHRPAAQTPARCAG